MLAIQNRAAADDERPVRVVGVSEMPDRLVFAPASRRSSHCSGCWDDLDIEINVFAAVIEDSPTTKTMDQGLDQSRSFTNDQ
jgi:hypothetical protein